MNRFSILVEKLENERHYRVSAEVDLIIKGENEGEVGYLADTELGSIKSHSDFRILNIEEISEEEYKELKIMESTETKQKDTNPADQIINLWNLEFGSRNPSTIEKFEFYRKLRNENKFDADLIMDTLKEKICVDWMKK